MNAKGTRSASKSTEQKFRAGSSVRARNGNVQKDSMSQYRMSSLFLLLLTLTALYGCVLLVAPFFKAILFACVVAMLFYPMHARIQRGGGNRTGAALMSTVIVILLVSLSALLLGWTLATG